MASNVTSQSSEKAYTIGGVPIIFPYKAYPVQITMMDRIIKCLNKQHNCLLESPTGTGKSLALLCASLAWLKKTTKEFNELEQMLQRNLNTYGVALPDDPQPVPENSKTSASFEKFRYNSSKSSPKSSKNSGCFEKFRFNSSKSDANNSKYDSSFEKFRFNSSKDDVKAATPKFESVIDCDEKIKEQDKNFSSKNVDSSSATDEISISLASSTGSKNDQSKKRGIFYIDDDDDFDDFQPIKRKLSLNSKETVNVPTSPINSASAAVSSPKQQINDKISKLKESTSCKDFDSVSCCKNAIADQTNSTIPVKLPKIYFGTRTHKQIDQIIRELKKTPYRNVKMTILSSRERTCVHPKVSRSRNKNEECDELIRGEEGPGCKYYINSIRSSCYQPSSAFDLEDFVSACKRRQVCPYFDARELLLQAEIVFCPYNYLVDPLIRSALNITLKGNVVIMDEAHNIEDSARDSASCSISVSQLQDAIADVLKIGQLLRDNSEPYMHIAKVLENVKRFLENSQDLNDYVTFDSSCKVWSGNDMIALLDYVGLGPDTFPTFLSMYSKITREESEMEKDKDKDVDKLSGKTHICMKAITMVLNYLYKDKPQFYPDYRIVITKSKSSIDESSISSSQISKRRSFSSPFEITLNFWCLNPGVAFTDFKDIHSLVVASGTLAPLTSFQSELGIPFHLSLEANHVIDSKNIWVGTIGKGPSNNPLCGTYTNANTFIFQDDVGNLVFQVCSLIPHGVLCFLPSYGMLDKLVNRWQITGLWDKLMTKKVVLSEPRRANDSFQQTIEDFYNAVKDSETDNSSSINGALLLAVCRGKVSEGFDFADNNARAVITIGIPFPNVKDAQVDLKKKYNDMYSSQRQIVSGNQWYEMQAFRALNQALGRCIRHKNDFGALIIADERFQKYDRYAGALSKWIKKEIKHYPTFLDALNSLNSFAENVDLKKFPEEEFF